VKVSLGPAVGLVGAGAWARFVHGPLLDRTAGLHLAGVWSRRAEKAERLATSLGVPAFSRYEDLLDACEAVVFAVPPAVQGDLAVIAAERGKAMLLEKPMAASLAGAQRLADAVAEAGVPSQLVLTWRYAAAVRAFLDDAAGFDGVGGRGVFVSDALLGGPFATPWRLERGALFDLGPHVIDLLDAALGPVRSVRAHGDPLRWTGLLLEHEGGAVSEASICATSAVAPPEAGVSVYGRDGALHVDCSAAMVIETFDAIGNDFAEVLATGRAHSLDVHRGLHLQRIIEAAEATLSDAT
jgi:predicted dehydrogenase